MRATRDAMNGDGMPDPAAQGVRALNEASVSDARGVFLACCSVTAWADAMVAARPFANEEAVLDQADAIWRDLGPDDWTQAFAGHPRIGERRAGSAYGGAHRPSDPRAVGWSQREQSTASSASDETKTELARVNAEYEHRFGHIYLVCANGRSAEELLADARERMHNDPETELRVAAEEQRQITRLRLTRLLEGEG